VTPEFPNRRYRELLERSPAGLLVTTLEGEILEANAASARFLGYESPEELRERNVREHYDDLGQREEMIARIRATGTAESVELRMRTRDGEPRWLLSSVTTDYDRYREQEVLLGTWVDVTELRKLREDLAHKAHHDELTGALNRRALYERSEQVLAVCHREDRKAAVVYVDLVGFKQVNEQLGHRGGDHVLRAVARRLEQTCRKSDLVARMGGDEFAILAPLPRDEEGVEQAARRLHLSFEEPFEVEDREIRVPAAMGVAVYPDDGSELDTLLDCADRAVWGADREKKPGLRRYRRALRMVGDDASRIRVELKKALQTGPDFFRLYQPIVAADSREPVGLEALVRWDHPERGIVGPAEFISVAEASGLIREIDRHVFRGAVRQAALWNRRGLPFGWLSVNLSTQSLADPEFLEFAEETLSTYPAVEPGQVVLEITEHAAMQQVREADILRRLDHQVGVSIAIDDFGIGYSSLLYLRHLPAGFLKIDMEFVHGLPESESDRKVIRGIIGLGRAFEMTLIAEGVEKERQASWLHEAGCSCLQGYLFARPMTSEEVEDAFAS